MTAVQRVVIVSGVAVLLFDTVVSIAAEQLGFSYGALIPISFLIYAVAGFAAGRAAGWKAGVVAGSLTAFIDATLGWAISWQLGPGRPPEGFTGIGAIVIVILTVTVSGAVFGLVGGALAQLGRPQKQAAA